MTPAPRIAAVVLAGGRGTRMGGPVPKPLLDLAGRPMIAHVLARLGAGVAPVLISAGDAAAFASLGLPVVCDRMADHAGPLAGLDAAAAHLDAIQDPATHLLCVPADAPLLPPDLARRLAEGAPDVPRVARRQGRTHFACALWPRHSLAALPAHLVSGQRSIRSFLDRGQWEAVDFDEGDADPFVNVNTPEDLAAMRTGLAQPFELLVKKP